MAAVTGSSGYPVSRSSVWSREATAYWMLRLPGMTMTERLRHNKLGGNPTRKVRSRDAVGALDPGVPYEIGGTM